MIILYIKTAKIQFFVELAIILYFCISYTFGDHFKIHVTSLLWDKAFYTKFAVWRPVFS